MTTATHPGPTLSFGDLSSDSNWLSGSISFDGHTSPFFFAASEPIGTEFDALFPVALQLAMKAGADVVRVPGALSPRLLGSAAQIQDILCAWDGSYVRTKVEADARAPGAPVGDAVACFFSGGVDSFYSVLKHDDEIKHLIFSLGFDLRLDGDPAPMRRAETTAREVAEALGKTLVVVRTDIRSFSDHYISGWYFHGAILAAMGLLFQHRFRKVIIPSTHNYADLFPWGSHPLLDPLWSTEETQFFHDGCEATRPEKVRFISSSEVAMNWLRVCFEPPETTYNCGRCEKCLRTMVALHLAGALGRCRTLPDTLDLRAVSRIRIPDDNARAFVTENLVAVEQAGGDPALERALGRALRLGPRLARIESARAALGARARGQLWARAPRLTARLKRLRDRRRSHRGAR
ncbi:MAG TPA: hypothetical protein VHG69_06390 [Thermoleophilaceae bacterium]|nr:hypothetical protein [Thermoleophilaceae bacterium]